MTVRATFNTWKGRARFLPLGDVVGWQEVNDPPDRIKLAASLPAYTHFVPDVEWAAAIPISWRADRFELVDKGRVKAHGGAAGITPARGCTWVLLRDVSTGVLVWHVNVHFISKIRLSNWRRLQWAMHLRTLQQLTDALLLHSPYGTVGGDFNNHNPVKIPGLVNLTPKWRGSQVWYDQLLVTEALVQGASVERGSNRLGSDHFPFMLTYQPPKTDTPEEPVPSIPTSGIHQPKRRFTDSSGRGVWASDYEWQRWEAVVFEVNFRPTITQSPWQKLNGGGAPDSAGYHDYGGTFDLRVRDLTDVQVARLIRVLRNNGCVAWLRNMQHGGFSDPHIHFVMAGAPNLSSGAVWQVSEYKIDNDGLSSRGSDYHPRPSPLVLAPTEGMFMPTADEIANATRSVVREELDKALADMPDAVWNYRLKVQPQFGKNKGKVKKAGVMVGQIDNRSSMILGNTVDLLADAEDTPPAA